MSTTFPRLLVATEWPPNGPGGGPALLRQTLKDWPVENLFWWSCQPDPSKGFGQKVADHRVASIPAKLYPHRRGRALKSWWLEQVWSRWATRHLQSSLRSLRPDAIWVIPQTWSIPPLLRALPTSGIKYHISVQDYPDIRGNIIRLGPDRCRRLATMVDQLYVKAASRDAICRPMVDDMRARTGCVGDIWHAGIEQEEIDYVAGKTESGSDKIRIAYAGTIIVEEAFEFVVAALAAIRQQLPRPLSLELFGGHPCRDRRWFDPSWIVQHGTLPDAQFYSELRKCTWGLTAMSLTDDDPRYNRFSFPTKSVTYMGAGLPILAVGHPESSVIKMAGTYRVGLRSSTNQGAELQRQLLEVLSEPQPFLKYKAEMQRCIAAEYEMPRLRRTMFEYLFACADKLR